MDEPGEVKEGFLCPMCMKDLGSASLLQAHFVEAHAIDEDASKAQNIKGIFDKAKRKVLKKPSDGFGQGEWGRREEVSLVATGKELDFSFWEPQDIGFCRDLTREFRRLRSETIDEGMIEMNTILIRLEKILKVSMDSKDSRLSGSSSKKEKERSLVPWISDSEAKVCFGCMKSFTVARRKHHCRLCGQVICGKCSEFLPLTFAVALCKLDGVQDLTVDAFDDDDDNEQNRLRICSICNGLLLRNYEFKKEKQNKIPLVKLYEKLTVIMSDADLLLPDFNKMAESLSIGDTHYSYKEVVNTRMRLLKMYETLEFISKKVLSLGAKNNDEDPDKPANHGKQSQKLQRGIHAFVTNYLQNNMFTLKSIPSEEEFVTLQAERSMLLRRRAEREKAQQEKAMKERAIMHKEVLRRDRDSRENSPLLGRRHDWRNTEQRNSLNSEADPLLEQINNVKKFIHKARENGQLEEINVLERNLNELQNEYDRRTKTR